MRAKIIIVLVIFVSTLWGVSAQEKECTLSLEECVKLALENNRKAKVANNNIEAAVNLKREAFTKYFPEISAAGMIFWANHDILQYNVLDILELGIIHKGKLAGVQALQPVFTGGQIVNGNKLAGVAEEVARLRSRQTQDELRVATETMYWKLVTLQATKETLSDAIATLDSLSNEVAAAVEAGVALNNDLLKVKLQRNTYAADMVDLDNGIKLVKMLLSQYIGQGPEGNISVSGSIPTQLPAIPDSLYIPADEALLLTADYKLLGKNVEAKKLEKRMTLGANLPSVAVGAGWYYHDLLEQNHNFGAVQIAVDVPLSAWWGGAYSLKKKDVEISNAKLELEDLSEELRINMTDKWNNLTAAHRKMEIEAEGMAQSAENLRLNRLYYEAGMTTVSDMLEAQTQHRQATDRYVAAYGAFQTALAAYLVATGR